ncbi:hypothetical protein A2572_04140 [Candidatus Collierbacteria bacterium RIFOXYD1_FULL_40_9]|uniref:DUF5671 domain-containing protein n=1 Tax=Candidatus Collierbacteria bacterium RIFOXYD1_FULL_40_9 TaxID=1817731 RepID=A0A1F5FPK2_9BACT|nr:MAG: hypothetical protein A2572_04140 [Candidatus Collierbacteria bacterium RIFOXYD1_FULL_40_9]
MNLRLLYLYLFSFVGLLIVVIGSIQMVDLGLKMTIFKGADTYEIYPSPKIDGMEQESPDVPMERQKRETNRQRQRQMVSALSMLVVGTPLYLYHWKLIKKESKV